MFYVVQVISQISSHPACAGGNGDHSLEACAVKTIGSEPLGRLLPMSLVSEFVLGTINNKFQFPLTCL